MKRLLAISIASASIAIGAIPAVAGVPQSESIDAGKWQKVSDNWLIDTKDVEIKGDELRFWVERIATGFEQASTQQNMSWKGKYRIRCGDFNARIDVEARNRYGMPYIHSGRWQKITPTSFGYTLASNFCYLTKTPGYTPEPTIYKWQRNLTAAIKKELTPGAIRARERKNKKNKVGCEFAGGISPRCFNND